MAHQPSASGPVPPVRPVAGEQVGAAHDDLAGVGARAARRLEVQSGSSSATASPSRHSSSPSAPTSRSSTPGIGRPIEPGFGTGLASVEVSTGAVSVSPYPTKTGCRVASVKRAAVAGSSGAAPQTATRTDAISLAQVGQQRPGRRTSTARRPRR